MAVTTPMRPHPGRQARLATAAFAVALAFGSAAHAQPPPNHAVPASVAVCFVPSPEPCTDEIVAAIDAARTEVRVISYEMTSRPIINALANAHGRGVDVQIVADKRNLAGPEYLANLGVDVRFDDRVTLQHNKVLVIDKRLVIGGSFNHTFSAQNRNGENVLFIQSDAIASKFLAYFDARQAVSRAAEGQ
jgi:phosphatidylserine/phosphatidylglycerophosphate/cardiolipin synthase-like enzyme